MSEVPAPGDLEQSLPAPFGKYELVERIGMGGMAEIFRARMAGPDGFEKVLVVKRILPEFAQDTNFVNMLVAEAKVTSLLQHPNIVQIYELGEIRSQYYIAMELVDGADLLDILARCTQNKLRVPTELALYIIAEVCKGLAHAHAATDVRGRPLNIIHRDVSPSNILISQTGDVKIMDFGVATADFGHTGPIEEGRPTLKGKIGYLSPEQVLGRPMDRRSDVFALGVILFECLTLKRLFIGKSDVQTLINIREARIERKFKRHSYIPKPIRTILATALAREPRHRFQTASDFQEAILDYLFENRLRANARTLAAFMKQVLQIPGRGADRTPPPPAPPPLPVDSQPVAPPPLPPLPEASQKAVVVSRGLRRVDLTRASFHLKNEDTPTFGPIDFERLTRLIQARSIGPREWISINGSDWTRINQVPTLVDLSPALFEDEHGRPLLDGPVNRLRTPRLLHQIVERGLDGKLKLSRGAVLKEIYFAKGVPVAVTSNQKHELLGSWLIRNGMADPDAVDRALTEARSLPIGRALVTAGHLQQAQLTHALAEQLRERVFDLFAWETGWYEFFAGVLSPYEPLASRDAPIALIVRGVRESYDLPSLTRIFDGYLHRPLIISSSRSAEVEPALDIGTREQNAKRRLVHDATLADILEGYGASQADRTDVLRMAFVLHQLDILSFRAPAG